jgi:uncharacterized protein YebE (UPF0316 family)
MDLLFAILGIGMMGIYAISFIKRLKNRYWRLGLDSILELIFYIAGLVILSRIV